MSFLDELKTAATIADKQTGTVCVLCDLILATEDEEVRELLASRRIGKNKLGNILMANGYGIGHAVVDRHRREGHQPV